MGLELYAGRTFAGLARPVSADASCTPRRANVRFFTALLPMRLALLRSLHAAGLEVLQTACPWEKAARTGRFQRFWAREVSGWDAERLAAGMPPLAVGSAEPPAHPARTEHPVLMDERSMPSPRALGVKPAPYLVHALAHIELNAVDLYWDVMVRSVGDGLPLAFYDDILRVAADEATHFGLLRRCLHAHGLDYGSIPAHTVRQPAVMFNTSPRLGPAHPVPRHRDCGTLRSGRAKIRWGASSSRRWCTRRAAWTPGRGLWRNSTPWRITCVGKQSGPALSRRPSSGSGMGDSPVLGRARRRAPVWCSASWTRRSTTSARASSGSSTSATECVLPTGLQGGRGACDCAIPPTAGVLRAGVNVSAATSALQPGPTVWAIQRRCARDGGDDQGMV